MWFEHIGNKQAVIGAFGDNIPALEGLELRQIVLDEAGGLQVALNLETLPANVPERWKKKGFDSLQLRFWFGVDDLDLHRRPELELPSSARRVFVELDKNRLRIASPDGSFELTAALVYSRLQLHPYRRSDYEFPPDWFHPPEPD